jgi:UPF0716 protein FxsA
MTPFRILFALFILIPLLEIYLLIEVGSIIGGLNTVLLIVFTAVLGAFLLRVQGFSTMHRVQATLARGEIPALEVLSGMVLLVSGALLLTPGFFTDAVGFLGLVPPLRSKLILYLLRHHIIVPGQGGNHKGGPKDQSGPRVIEGEYHREDD